MFHTDLNIINEMKLVNLVFLSRFKIYIFADASQERICFRSPLYRKKIYTWDFIAGDINLAEYAHPSGTSGLTFGFSESI